MGSSYEQLRARAEGFANSRLHGEIDTPLTGLRWSVQVDAHMEGEKAAEQRLEAALAAAVAERDELRDTLQCWDEEGARVLDALRELTPELSGAPELDRIAAIKEHLAAAVAANDTLEQRLKDQQQVALSERQNAETLEGRLATAVAGRERAEMALGEVRRVLTQALGTQDGTRVSIHRTHAVQLLTVASDALGTPFAAEPGDLAQGVFWRDGEPWVRQGEEESRCIDVAPNLERARRRARGAATPAAQPGEGPAGAGEGAPASLNETKGNP